MKLHKHRLRELLASTSLFNAAWYLRHYTDVRDAGLDPLEHFINYGLNEGRSPSPLFSSQWYCSQCPSVQDLGAFEHFLLFGSQRNLDPHPLFSIAYYKSQLPDIDWRTNNPLFHYFANASKAAVNPHPLFDTVWYLRQIGENCPAAVTPLEHFLLHGWQDFLDPHPLFSVSHYLWEHPELTKDEICPLVHYVMAEDFQGLDPHPIFMSEWYMQQFPVLSNSIGNPLVHYLQVGAMQNRKPHPLFDPQWYTSQHMTEADGRTPPLLHYAVMNAALFKGRLPECQKSEALARIQAKASKEEDIQAFVVHNIDCISGGIFSVFSLAAETRKNGRPTFLYTMAGDHHVVRFSRFQNDETLLTFNDLSQHVQQGKIRRINIPEVLLEDFFEATLRQNIDLSKIDINILNQNDSLMPPKTAIDFVAQKVRAMSMTTAHLKYSTQQHANKWGLALKHLSTYMSYDDYVVVPFEHKRPLFFWSPDRRPQDDSLYAMMIASMPAYHFYRIANLHYEFFKFAIAAAKFTLTLGEGLDNYFIEAFFTGGFGFALYNGQFMPQAFRSLDNVFSDLTTLKASLPCVIRDIECDPQYRHQLFEANYNALAAIYDKRIYQKKVSEFLAGGFDYVPNRPLIP